MPAPFGTPQDPAQIAQDNIEAAANAAPELQSAPGATLDVATSGGNVTNAAQGVAAQGNRVANAAAAQNAQSTAGGGIMGFLGHAVSHLAHAGEDVAGAAMKAVSMPLGLVTHEWRYLHDVEARHGFGAALFEGLGIVAAAAAGVAITAATGGADLGVLAGAGLAEEGAAGAIGEAGAGLLTGGVEGAAGAAGEGEAGALGAAGAAGGTEGAGGVGTVAGREISSASLKLGKGLSMAGRIASLGAPPQAVIPGVAAGAGLGMVAHPDSWHRTANPNYKDPHTGKTVNFGDDVAGFLGVKGAPRTLLSASSNAIFDLALDPLASAGSRVGKFKEANRAMTLQNVDAIASSDNWRGQAMRRAASWIAAHDAAEIAVRYPTMEDMIQTKVLNMGPLGEQEVKGLADAKSMDEVFDVFRNHLVSREALHPHMLPSLTAPWAGMERIREHMGDAQANYLHPLRGIITRPQGTLDALTQRVPGTTFDPQTGKFINGFDPVNMKGSVQLYHMLRLGMTDTQAKMVINLMYNADLATRHIIFRNANLMTLMGHAGISFSSDHITDEEWFKNAIPDALKHIRNPKFREAISRKIDELNHPFNPSDRGVYGGTTEGEGSRNTVDPETGREENPALLEFQTGDLPLMSYSNVHHMAQKLHGGASFTGALDDFLMNHVTDPIFKRWILMSLGYAQHISLAEMIPNTFRNGFASSFRSAYATVLEHLGMEADKSPDELQGMTKIAYDLLSQPGMFGNKVSAAKKFLAGPLLKSLKGFQAGKHYTAKELYKFAPRTQRMMEDMAAWVTITKSHLQMPGTQAHGGNMVDSHGDDRLGKASGPFRQAMERMKWIRGNNYTLYGPEHWEHLNAWKIWLNQIAKSPASVVGAKAMTRAYAGGAEDWEAFEAARKAIEGHLRAQSPEFLDKYMRAKHAAVGDPVGTDPLVSWSHDLTENLRAATHKGTQAHEVDMNLLDNIAGGAPTPHEYLHTIPVEDRPLAVPGREMIQQTGHFWARLSSIGYQRVLNPVVNGLSRQPLAFQEFTKNMRMLDHMVDKGYISKEDQIIKSASMATRDAIRFIHNVHDRTQLDQLLRNWVPFFFAQEQAYRRMGRLLVTNPGAFRRYMLAIQSVHDISAKTQDGNGNQYFAFPGSGFLDHLTVGAMGLLGFPTASVNPTGFGGTLSSANVIFPLSNGLRPDISPVVTMAAEGLYHFLPEFGQHYGAFKGIGAEMQTGIFDALGSQNMSENILQQVIPNTTAYRALEVAGLTDTSVQSALLMSIQYAAYEQNVAMRKWYDGGQKGPKPEIIPGDNATDLQLQDFVNRIKGQTRGVFAMRLLLGALSPVSADVMVDDFGFNQKINDAIKSQGGNISKGFQKFLLENPDATPYVVSKSQVVGGAKLPDTQGAIDWVAQHRDLINQYQAGGLWLMPRLADTKYSAQAYLEEIAQGLRQRRDPMQFIKAIYAENGDQIYYNALKTHEANIQGGGNKSQEYAAWDAYVNMLKAQHPIWWSQFNSGDRANNSTRAINELNDIFAKGLAPKGQQTTDVQDLLDQFNQYQSLYMAAGATSSYASAQKQVRDQWVQYCTALAQEKPNLDSIISSVFKDALTWYNQT